MPARAGIQRGRKWMMRIREVSGSWRSKLTIDTALPDVRLHLLIAVFRADVTLSCQEKLNLLISCAQDGGKF